MSYVFGPVPSRRLGLSLGIDLIPAKTCTYDCLYCQVGRTTCKTLETKPFVPVREVLEELEHRLEKTRPDTITLAGSGEPTLHSQIDKVIALIKGMTDIKVALLTNGSLLGKEEIRNRILDVDIILPTISTGFEETFRAIHRPHTDLNLSMVIEGLRNLRQTYKGRIFMEVVLLSGFNDSDKEIEGIQGAIDEISPDKIQLNTVVRPPADSRAVSLDTQGLESIKDILGEKTEIIADVPSKQQTGEYDFLDGAVLEMIKRRPVRSVDIANILNMTLDEVEGLIKGLIIKGYVREQEHSGEIFYVT